MECLYLKRGVLGIFLVILFIVTPVGAVSYEQVSFVDDNVEVFVKISADTPWSSPFSEIVNISIDVVPQDLNVLQVNISRVSLIVNRAEADQSGFVLITLEYETNVNIVSANEYANYTNTFTVSAASTGMDCYFTILVEGSYYNGTHQTFFQSLAPDDLVGPFLISSSIATPTVWVGLLVLAVAGFIFIGGIFGVKKSRSRVRRKSLMDE